MAQGSNVDDMGNDPADNLDPERPPPAPPKAPKTGDFWGEFLGSGGRTPDDLKNFLVSSGWGDAGYKQGGKKGDMLTDPSGKTWDAIYSAGDPTHSHFQQFDPSQASPAAAGYAAVTGAAPPAAPAALAYPPGVGDAIAKLLKRGFITPSDTDPEIASQMAPISRSIQRGAQRTRQAAAERAASTGNLSGGAGSGSFDAGVNAINEGAAEQEGQAMGGLIGKEILGRREDINNALQFAQGEEKMALQAQLAQADNELRRLGIDLQGRSINNQNAQFYDTLSYNMAHDAANDNTLNAVINLLS